MSHVIKTKKAKPEAEHGTTMSYFAGFVLSLLLTAIPYYLVVNQIISGSALLATIIGFAILQMMIQILFFLHLGRGPKPLYNVFFFVATAGIIILVVGGSIFIISHLHYNMSPSEVSKNLAEKERIYQVGGVETGACPYTRDNHKIIIRLMKVTPTHTNAQLCDTLTFISQDEVLHEITFGTHPAHDSYSGEDNLALRNNRNKTITLNQTGTFLFHDHLNPAINGSFTVTE